MKKENSVFNSVVDELKSNCRSYLVHKKDTKSVSFTFYSILSQSSEKDIYILNSFINTFDDTNLELQNYLCLYSDLKYCLSLLLSDYYKVSSSMGIAEFLDTESRIFDFLVNIALSGNPADVDSMDMIKSLCVAALTA
ncbi:hypothetical protein SDC9_164025 [bioreactor metagenome]|uniref:Uncharacterized protein n=1 Tax=bioreactor metagenome TaxID=1076179 RepID=A0A645FS10_9ZZZZ